MSTKIYNGYCMPKSLDLLEDFMIDFREKGQEIIIQNLTKLTAGLTSYNVDRFFFGTLDDEQLADCAISKVMRHIDNEYKTIRTTRQRNPLFDFECEISVLVPKNSEKTLLMLFTEQKELKELFESYEYIKEYFYWDNTDMLETVSEEEWKQRSKDWDAALPGSGVPARNGLTFELVGDYLPIIDVEDILGNMPSFEDRCKKVAKEKVSSYIKDQSVWDKLKSGSGYQFLQAVQEFEKSDEGIAAFNELMEKAKETLPKDLTREIIVSNLNEDKMLSDLKASFKM